MQSTTDDAARIEGIRGSEQVLARILSHRTPAISSVPRRSRSASTRRETTATADQAVEDYMESIQRSTKFATDETLKKQ